MRTERLKNPVVGLVLALGLALAYLAMKPNETVVHAGCSVSSNTPSITTNITVTENDTYTVWARIKAPNNTANSFNLDIENGTCHKMGDKKITANKWTWVNYQNGDPSKIVRKTLKAKAHTVRLSMTEAGVGIDKVLFVADPNCVPVGLGDNCNETLPDGDPSIILNGLSDNQVVSGKFSLEAVAQNTPNFKSFNFFIDGVLINKDSTAPYCLGGGGNNCAKYDSTKLSNGTHTIRIKLVYGSTNTDRKITINVDNSGPDPVYDKADINRDGKVSILDLSYLLSRWNNRDNAADDADLNDDGVVNIYDLSFMLSRWSK